tara:strand:+ start:8845 stop:9474 length:630 start_codon:yes stop_codon:yes gene_type:complete
MPKTDILKLIFHHDQRLDDLAPSEETVDENPLTTFTNPDPTYSTLYFSGSDLENEKFGINVLSKFDDLLDAIEQGFEGVPFISKNGKQVSFKKAIKELEMNEALVITNDEIEPDIIHSFTRKMLRDVLEKGWIIIYKREAKDGFDIHLFSKKNIYTNFFYLLQNLLPDAFRFFSINGKRLSSEKQFYFEQYSLAKPPHGFEEVFPESVL